MLPIPDALDRIRLPANRIRYWSTVNMKTLMIVAALAGVLTTTSAFAQSANAGTAATQVSANAVAQGNQVSPYGQPVAQKTRAQVYQELVQAEQDGQLAYLNATVYAH
jgi:hypothetical protein